MKHLTNYKLFESNQGISDENVDIVANLEDICLDLQDDGYNIRVHNRTPSGIRSIGESKVVVDVNMIKGGSYIPIMYTDIKETFERMDNYMKSLGWESHMEYWVQKFSGGYMSNFTPPALTRSTLKTNLFAIIFTKKK